MTNQQTIRIAIICGVMVFAAVIAGYILFNRVDTPTNTAQIDAAVEMDEEAGSERGNVIDGSDITEKPVLSFSIVTQEFWYTRESIDTINRIIDIHEQNSVPIDVIVDDASMQLYAQHAPEVINRLKNSGVVAVSYHIRAPRPYFQRFDFAGLSDLSDDGLYDALTKYEEYAVDLETGETTEAPGGFQFVKDSLGYPPVMSGLNTDLQFTSTLAQVYKDK